MIGLFVVIILCLSIGGGKNQKDRQEEAKKQITEERQAEETANTQEEETVESEEPEISKELEISEYQVKQEIEENVSDMEKYSTAENEEYILPNSNSKYITQQDIYGMTEYSCRLARNEIYARHGRTFFDKELQDYFNTKSWYMPSISPDDFSDEMLNDYEFENVKTIKERELWLEDCQSEKALLHMYDLIIEDTTWFDARDKCLQRGGYLATITSQEEMNQIINQILSEGKEEITFYIGATRDYTYNFGNGVYGWVHGQGEEVFNISQDFWLPGEPSYWGEDVNGNQTEEMYVDLFYRSSDGRGYLNDVSNDIIMQAPSYSGKIGYICEYEYLPSEYGE